MAKIMLVEDDAHLASRLKDSFSGEGHLLEVVSSGEDAMHLLRSFQFDILILDWTLPGMTGLDVCKSYRKNGGLANIILLTGRGDIADKEQALSYGADDYVTKPFDLRELFARVRSVLRRPHTLAPNEVKAGDLVLDLKLRTITTGASQKHLMPRESELLEFLMRHPDRVYSSHDLAREMASADSELSSDTVRSWMRNLRLKLAEAGAGDLIKTIPKAGYMLSAELPD